MKNVAILLCALPILSACSNKQIYEAVQHNQQVECGRLPQEQYEKCMKEVQTPYEEYERARKE